MTAARTSLTVRELRDIADESADAFATHGLPVLEAKCRGLARFAQQVIDGSHMGCAADDVILQLGEEDEDDPVVLFLLVAAILRAAFDVDARAEQADGNVWVVYVPSMQLVRGLSTEWAFGNSGEVWTGSQVIIGETGEHGTVVRTIALVNLPSTTTDENLIAAAISRAVETYDLSSTATVKGLSDEQWKALVDQLRRAGYAAVDEGTGGGAHMICVAAGDNGTTWNIGTVNECWDGDLMTADGSTVLDTFHTDVPVTSVNVTTIATAILAALDAKKVARG